MASTVNIFPPVEAVEIESNKTDTGSLVNLLSVHKGNWKGLEGYEKYNVDLKDLFVGKKFASGTYGRLYVGYYKSTEVAIKILNSITNDPVEVENLTKQFKQEVSMLAGLQHPNIVKFLGASQNPPTWLIITEYLSGGNLRKFLESNHSNVSLEKSVSMALDVSRALKYLHSKDIIHRDLKPDNLVFSGDERLKLTDFGISRSENATAEMTAEAGTFRWMAPEIMDAKHYSKNVDVYSFGILFWQFLTQQTPFEDMTPVQVAFGVAMKNARPEIPKNCPLVLSELMQQCWSGNPKKRPSFQHIVYVLSNFLKELKRESGSLSSSIQRSESVASKSNMDENQKDSEKQESGKENGKGGNECNDCNEHNDDFDHNVDNCVFCKESLKQLRDNDQKTKKKSVFSQIKSKFKKITT